MNVCFHHWVVRNVQSPNSNISYSQFSNHFGSEANLASEFDISGPKLYIYCRRPSPPPPQSVSISLRVYSTVDVYRQRLGGGGVVVPPPS